MPVSLGNLLVLMLGTTYVREGSSVPMLLQQDFKCGKKPLEPNVGNFYTYLSRIVGGNQVQQGSHPWQVSLKRQNIHFCGGTLVSPQWVITAAHCVQSRYLLSSLTITAGEHDLSLTEEEEQTLPVKYIISHPKFDPKKPMNYDIALLKVDGNFKYGPKVWPACLPNPDEKFDPGSICSTCGWGRLRENGILPQVLHEVELPILDHDECSRALSTLKKPIQGDTLMCAGFPDGGKDACQGDSGGPLVCMSEHGSWTLVGVTSWGMGCARGWMHNLRKKYNRRGSPGVFTDLIKLLPWIQQHMATDVRMKSSTASCSIQDGRLPDNEGRLHFPESPKHFYLDNQLCVWTLLVPEGMHILLNFSHFDVEPDTFCDYDSLSVISRDDRLLGKFCGLDPPSPILIGSNSVRLKFVSDNKEHGTGFFMKYQAVAPAMLPNSGCGSLAILFEEGTIQSMHYPEAYSNLADCQWIIHAPENHVVKLTYEHFKLEENRDCTYDSVMVYENIVMDKEMARSCGFAIPAPILSSSSTMLIKFHSDESETFGGFRATFSFIPIADLNISNTSSEVIVPEQINDAANVIDIPDNSCGIASNQPRFLFSRITGGEEAVPYSWPWQASMQISGENICGGTVLTNMWVVSAAHCFIYRKQYRDLWRVVVGVHDIKAQESNSQKRVVKKYIIHPDFNSTTMDSDIALVQLNEPLEFNHVRPVCLPEKDEKVEPSRVCVITGWGIQNEDREKSRKLQQLEVPILDSEACHKYYLNHSGGVSKKMFCAGFPAESDKDSCTGDSGGPLVCPSEDSSYYTLNGIISWGFGCGRKDYPGVYTNVASFIDWINQHISGISKPLLSF
ncbi:ovochymase-2 [Eublepharis macularius]|uniref:Ovochymase-2 n=1 Tax=Eublepharis macularius TaxID=481883 RepID=A0AA97IZE5_EUBMA|nr:ovochymase-2 [Eublepharis macularius]